MQLLGRTTRALVIRLLLGAAAMFAFALFVMPPLYDLFCDFAGVGGRYKGGVAYQGAPQTVDKSREITVQFVAATNETMPWEFRPMEYKMVVHPGEQRTVKFYARNTTDSSMTAQAIPSFVPGNSADYFHKTQCFCFSSQSLAAGEEAEMPVVFIVDQDLPASVNTITLSYTLFDVTNRLSNPVATLH